METISLCEAINLASSDDLDSYIDDRILLENIVDKLLKSKSYDKQREIQIFVLRFVYGYTLEEIGRQMGVTRERIRRIIERQKICLKNADLPNHKYRMKYYI